MGARLEGARPPCALISQVARRLRNLLNQGHLKHHSAFSAISSLVLAFAFVSNGLSLFYQSSFGIPELTSS